MKNRTYPLPLPEEGKKMPLEIRPLAEADVPAVVNLSLRAWAPVFESIEEALGSQIFGRLHPDWRVSQQRAVEAVCTSGTTRVWVAQRSGSTVGFVAVNLHHDSSLVRSTCSPSTPTTNAEESEAPSRASRSSGSRTPG